MATEKEETIVDPVDAEVGGDADIGGIAQTVTADDIQAILISNAPRQDRKNQLVAIREELRARVSADRGHEIEPLLAEVDKALDDLESRGDVISSRSGMGMDPSERADLGEPSGRNDQDE